MDIAAFINELLTQLGILVVPGLGTFTRSRADGYYSKEQQQFYPPTLQIQFTPKHTDDNVLAERIAKERQISVASAKYFVEKFVNHLRDEAAVGTVNFGAMGSFSTRRGVLLFANSALNETSEEFYGLAPVKLKRISAFKQMSLLPTPPPATAKPAVAVMAEPGPGPKPVGDAFPELILPLVPSPVAAPDEVEQYPDEEEPRRKANVWLVLAIVIIIFGLSIFTIYLLKPNWFRQYDPNAKYLKNSPAFIPKEVKKDSAKKTARVATLVDSVRAEEARTKKVAIAPPVPVVVPDTFRIVVSAVKTAKEGRIEVERFAKMGLSAGVHKAPGRSVLLVCVGDYLSNDSAKAALPLVKKKIQKPIRIQIFLSKK